MQKFLCAFVACCSFSVSANVIITSTRVVYPAGAKSVSVQLVNKSREQHLIQSWIDDGRVDEKPENIITPFRTAPPVVKINGDDGQTIKITHDNNAKDLPQDRESIFWLNVLDIPPVPVNRENSGNYMQFAIRNRIKLFWRPEGLAVKPGDIAKNLSINLKGTSACIDNATPYYVTLLQAMVWDGKSTKIQKGKKSDNLIRKALLIPPYSCRAPEGEPFRPKAKPYQLVYIDDFGSRNPAIAQVK
ncbi:molecular chaperone [Kalamiella sp. sgz302252]|uniref:fimbrial biogenesis chaperone n=1 Tax=Pantoea sp. sgz302252 TaxID=3341827 RepID=UPI0036D40A3F